MLTYREARNDDVPAMASIRAAEWGTQEYWMERIPAYLRGESDPQHARKTRVGYVACDDSGVVGFITGHLTSRHGCNGELQWINVAQAYRGSEMASELLHLIAKWFVGNKSLKVCVDVEPTNLSARKFYRKHGAVDLNPHWLVWNDIGVVLGDRQASQAL
jgi:ribosomal protein S18 acetylase RimI-like enzyme